MRCFEVERLKICQKRGDYMSCWGDEKLTKTWICPSQMGELAGL